MDYAKLATEQFNARSEQLDTMSATEIAALMNELDLTVVEAVRTAVPAIGKAAEYAADSFRAGGRLIYLGAGTSGRLGVLDASECPPTFSVPHGMVVGRIAGGDTALRTAVEGAEDSAELGAHEIDDLAVTAADTVIAISASGTARYCVGALDRADALGAKTVSLCCNPNAPLAAHASLAVCIPTGPEVLSGSTRLRAGTATKMALNMISTAAMVSIGKAYRNLMVDVSATNVKLRDRAIRITMQACALDRAGAEQLLARAGGGIKTAIVMHETDCDATRAREALKNAAGNVRKAILSAINS